VTSDTGDIANFEADDWLTIRHDFSEKVDYANLNGNDGVQGVLKTSWKSNPLNLDVYDYYVEKNTQPYSVKYTFNGKANTENPHVSFTEHGGGYTWGQDFYINPEFHKCLYQDCIEPKPVPPTLPPSLVDCNFLNCGFGSLADFADLHIPDSQRVIIDAAAVSNANGHFKFGGVTVDGTFVITADSVAAGETLTIELDHLITNTGRGQ
jgi:hypothetical protein